MIETNTNPLFAFHQLNTRNQSIKEKGNKKFEKVLLMQKGILEKVKNRSVDEWMYGTFNELKDTLAKLNSVEVVQRQNIVIE